MIKGLAITPPVIGRISIGRMVEKNGKRLPEKDDQFTITTQIQTREGWLPHPLDEALRQEVQGKKLRSIPVTLPFNDPDLNLRAEYTFFERKSGWSDSRCNASLEMQCTTNILNNYLYNCTEYNLRIGNIFIFSS